MVPNWCIFLKLFRFYIFEFYTTIYATINGDMIYTREVGEYRNLDQSEIKKSLLNECKKQMRKIGKKIRRKIAIKRNFPPKVWVCKT